MKTKKIYEVVDLRRGASPRPIQDFLSAEGAPWVKISDATASTGRYINKTKEYIKEEGTEYSVEVLPEQLILSNSATPGLPKIMGIKAYVHDGWLVFDNYHGVSRDYLYYFFINKRNELVNQANGSVFRNLKTDIVKNFDINIPSIEQQNKIADILSSFDKKIELNSRINSHLENMGLLLIRNYNISCSNTCRLSDIMKFCNGFAFKNKDYEIDGKYKILTIKNVQDGSVDCNDSNKISLLPDKIKEECILKIGDVVLSLTGNVGRVGIVAEYNCLLNQRVAKIMPIDVDLLPCLYFVFRNPSFKYKLKNISKGTAQSNLSPVETLNIEIPYDKEKFSELSAVLKPIFNRGFGSLCGRSLA